MSMSLDYAVRLPGLKIQLCHFCKFEILDKVINYLCLNFLISKIELKIVPTSQD